MEIDALDDVLIAAPSNDMLVAKLHGNDGHVLWTRKFSYNDNKLQCGCITCDPLGNAWLVANSSQSSDIIKLDSCGTRLGIYHLTAEPAAPITNVTIFLNTWGELCIAGTFQGKLKLGGKDLVTGIVKPQVFITKTANNPTCVVTVRGSNSALQLPRRFPGTVPDSGHALAVDFLGNAVIGGSFTGTVDFGDGREILASKEFYLIKLGLDGNRLWVFKDLRGLSETGVRAATDGDANVVVSGGFTGTVQFGERTLSGSLLVAKITDNGQPLWGLAFSGTRNDLGHGIAVNRAGTVAVVGAFDHELYLGGEFLLGGGNSVFVVKLGPDGSRILHPPLKFSASGVRSGLKVALDRPGNVVLSGIFYAPVAFGGEPLIAHASDGLFIVKLAADDGRHRWSHCFSGQDIASASNVAVDPAGNIYVAGSFTGALYFGENKVVTGTATASVFVAMLGAEGGDLRWMRLFSSTKTTKVHTLAVDAAGNILLAGAFSGTVSFDEGSDNYKLSNEQDQQSLFLVKLDTSNQMRPIWCDQFIGIRAEMDHTLTVDLAGNIFLSGCFQGTADFSGFRLTGSGGNDLFVVKLVPQEASYKPVVVKRGGDAVELAWSDNMMHLADEFTSDNGFVVGSHSMLALANSAVGGVIRDNTMAGDLVLMSDLPTTLVAETMLDAKKLLNTNADLQIRGNLLNQVVSKVNPEESGVSGFSRVFLVDNTQKAPLTSLVARFLSMSGNHFLSDFPPYYPSSEGEKDTVAVVLAESITVTANQADDPKMIIRKWASQSSDAANLLGFRDTVRISPVHDVASASQGERSVQVKARASVQWQVDGKADWITMGTQTTGSGSGSFTYSVSRNDTGSTRKATFRIIDPTTKVSLAILTIEQQSSSILPVFKHTILAKGETRSFIVNAPSQWTATSNVPWIVNVNPSQSGTVTYDVQENIVENAGTNKRLGTVTITIGSLQETFQVEQEGCPLTIRAYRPNYNVWPGHEYEEVQPDSIAVDKYACTCRIDVSGGLGCKWTVQNFPNVPWLSHGIEKKDAGGSVYIYVEALQGTTKRPANFQVAGKTVSIIQEYADYGIPEEDKH